MTQMVDQLRVEHVHPAGAPPGHAHPPHADPAVHADPAGHAGDSPHADTGTHPGDSAPAGQAYPVYTPPPPGRFAGFMLRMYARFPRWTAPLAIVVCFAGAAGYLMIREPTDGAFDQTTCLAKLTTGFDCPGCGGTRAFFYLVQGNLPAAARHHLVLVFAAPFLTYMFLAWALNQSFGWRLPQLRPTPLVVSVFLAIAGAFTILRNLPWEPFTWFYV